MKNALWIWTRNPGTYHRANSEGRLRASAICHAYAPNCNTSRPACQVWNCTTCKMQKKACATTPETAAPSFVDFMTALSSGETLEKQLTFQRKGRRKTTRHAQSSMRVLLRLCGSPCILHGSPLGQTRVFACPLHFTDGVAPEPETGAPPSSCRALRPGAQPSGGGAAAAAARAAPWARESRPAPSRPVPPQSP